MANVNLTVQFDYTDAAGNVYSDGSTSVAKTIAIDGDEIFDRTYAINSGTLTAILNNDKIASFDFLWIESDQAGEVQLVCNEGGTTGASNLENGFVIALNAGIPLILANDDSRNQGSAATNIDSWQTNWTADVIDRIQWYHTTGAAAKVRVIAIT